MKLGFAVGLTAIAVIGFTQAAKANEVGPPAVVLPAKTVLIIPQDTFDPQYTAGDYVIGPSEDIALFGADPHVYASYSGDAGSTTSELTYDIEVLPAPPGIPNAASANTVPVAIDIAAMTYATPDDIYDPRVDALFEISSNAFRVLYMENCAGYAGDTRVSCSYGGPFTVQPISSVVNADLVPGIDYTVELRVDVTEHGYAEIDPIFTAPAGYYIDYSAGVVQGGVPEPAAWALMLLGIGGVGAAMRLAKRRNGPVSASV